MALKMQGMEINGDVKVEEFKEPNYRGVKAMPFVIGNTHLCLKTVLRTDRLVQLVDSSKLTT
ncbi:hypothetical protein Hanom_Chr00s001030g01672291 [Helianthus anomalus]